MRALSVTRNGARYHEPPYCLLGMSGSPRQLGPPDAFTIGRLSGYVYDGTPSTKLELTIAPGLMPPTRRPARSAPFLTPCNMQPITGEYSPSTFNGARNRWIAAM